MLIKIELVKHRGKSALERVKVSDGLRGDSLIKAIDVAVIKKFSGDKNWRGWNLIGKVGGVEKKHE